MNLLRLVIDGVVINEYDKALDCGATIQFCGDISDTLNNG